MSEFDEPEFDVHEYAEQLGYTDELGRHDFSDPSLERATTKSSRALSRRDLVDRKSTRLNSSHWITSRMPSSA